MSKSIYIFSGLGADKRVFHRLDLPDLNITHINWIVPMDREPLRNYALRIRDQIIREKPVLIGYSFGGIMAHEVARQIETSKIILIASVKTKNEIPYYYRMAGNMRLHRMVPSQLLTRSNYFMEWLFGTTSEADRTLLKKILKDTDPVFLRWAMEKIMGWSNTERLPNTIHIHGTNDRILPLKFIECDFKIRDGGHLMVLDKSKEISDILVSELTRLA